MDVLLDKHIISFEQTGSWIFMSLREFQSITIILGGTGVGFHLSVGAVKFIMIP